MGQKKEMENFKKHELDIKWSQTFYKDNFPFSSV